MAARAQSSSGARHYTAPGFDGVEFGLIGEGTGTDKEWVSSKSLPTYAAIPHDFLVGFK